MFKKAVTLNNNTKRFKFFKSNIKTLKKKVIFKKKKYAILKKKKLNIIYKNYCLENNSLLYKLYRQLLKKQIVLHYIETFLNLKLKLKKLNFINTSKFFVHIIDFINFSLINKKKISSKRFLVKFCLSITIHSNNIFMNLAKSVNSMFTTVKYWSAGFFDFICSKTKLKFAISAMLKEVKMQLKKLKIYVIKINAPKHLNRYIFKQLFKLFYKSKFLIYSSFKIFNGCRSSKKRRKKRLRFRFFR